MLDRMSSGVVRVSLDWAARAVLWQGKFVGWLYSRLWPILGVSWFDHRFDYLLGPGYWYWSERGVLGAQAIQEGDSVLDLCCGDGLFSALFYGVKAGHVDAVDRDARAIALARRRYARSKISYSVADAVVDEFPGSGYNVVFLFSAIEHFSAEAGARLLQKIGNSLCVKGGVLLGSTPLVTTRGGHNFEHDNEFLSAEQLRSFLSSHFKSVELWCSPWPRGRMEGYFRCREPIALNDRDIHEELERYHASFLDVATR